MSHVTKLVVQKPPETLQSVTRCLKMCPDRAQGVHIMENSGQMPTHTLQIMSRRLSLCQHYRGCQNAVEPQPAGEAGLSNPR